MSNYINWLIGDCQCGCQNNYRQIDNCDCDTINLNISNLKTDVNVLSGDIEQINEYLENTVSIDELENYYTKEEVDSLIPTVPSFEDYYTKLEIDSKGYITNADLSDYATKAYVNSQGFLTEYQPLKTVNNQSLIGDGNIVIEGSVDVDSALSLVSTNPVENKAITEALNGKLDASGYTPTDLSNYYTKSEVDAKDGVINDNVNILRAITNNKQDKLTAGDNISIVNNVISATVPSNVSAFNNDAGYITSASTIFNDYVTSGAVETQITNHFWCGTQAEYDVLPTKQNNVLYLIHE